MGWCSTVTLVILACVVMMNMVLNMPSDNYQHDIFLSFRGEEVRSNFLSYLHHSLTESNVKVFIDEKLDRGEKLTKGTVLAIQQSRVSVVIFSSDFASSTWCLDEVGVIMESHGFRRMVVPVFYRIDPSDVEFQNGTFEHSFIQHEDTYRCSRFKVQRWRKSLKDASNLAGWVSNDYRSDIDLVRELVKDVRSKLEKKLPKFENELNLMVRYCGRVMKYVEAMVSGYHRFREEVAEY